MGILKPQDKTVQPSQKSTNALRTKEDIEKFQSAFRNLPSIPDMGGLFETPYSLFLTPNALFNLPLGFIVQPLGYMNLPLSHFNLPLSHMLLPFAGMGMPLEDIELPQDPSAPDLDLVNSPDIPPS